MLGHTERRVLREELDAVYPEDIAGEVRDRLAIRNDCTLLRAQREVLGPTPTSRDDFDPSHVLSYATGGDKVLVLDSNQLDQNWTEEDLGALINSMRKPRADIGSETSSQVCSKYWFNWLK